MITVLNFFKNESDLKKVKLLQDIIIRDLYSSYDNNIKFSKFRTDIQYTLDYRYILVKSDYSYIAHTCGVSIDTVNLYNIDLDDELRNILMPCFKNHICNLNQIII